jgi:hypothetical protein
MCEFRFGGLLISVAALCGAATGCVGPALTATDSVGADETDATARQRNTGLADPGLQLLAGALSGLELDEGLGLVPALRDLREPGFSRRTVALLALDAVAAEAELAPEQDFALDVTRACLNRDAEALAELVLAPLVSGLSAADAAP